MSAPGSSWDPLPHLPPTVGADGPSQAGTPCSADSDPVLPDTDAGRLWGSTVGAHVCPAPPAAGAQSSRPHLAQAWGIFTHRGALLGPAVTLLGQQRRVAACSAALALAGLHP